MWHQIRSPHFSALVKGRFGALVSALWTSSEHFRWRWPQFLSFSFYRVRGEKFTPLALFITSSRIMLHSSLVKLSNSLIVAGSLPGSIGRHHHTLARNLCPKYFANCSLVAPSFVEKRNQSTSSKDKMEKFALASKYEGLEKNIW